MRLYILGPAADWLTAGGGSILAFLALAAAGERVTAEAATAFSVWSLTWLVNGLHFAATNWRLYRSRANAARFPLTASLAPAAVLAGAAAALSFPAVAAPWFVKLFLLWSPYHYAGQAVGLSVLYGRRGGCELGRIERAALAAFLYGCFAAGAATAESVGGVAYYLAVPVPSLGLPRWVAVLCWCWAAACGSILIASVVARLRRGDNLPPPIAAIPALALLVWFAAGPRVPRFYETIAFFHGLQYLPVAWLMQLQDRLTEDSGARPGFLGRETARWLGGNLAVYFLLFWLFPRGLAAAWGLPIGLAAAVAIAAVQIHHFFVDGVIWRLRDVKVGRPLMGTLADFRTEPA